MSPRARLVPFLKATPQVSDCRIILLQKAESREKGSSRPLTLVEVCGCWERHNICVFSDPGSLSRSKNISVNIKPEMEKYLGLAFLF